MSIMVARPAISARRKRIALFVAITADVLLWCTAPLTLPGVFSLLEDARDVIVAILLLCIVGFRWQLVVAFLIELVPGLDLCPTWTAFVLLLPTTESAAVDLAQIAIPIVTAHTVPREPPVATLSEES